MKQSIILIFLLIFTLTSFIEDSPRIDKKVNKEIIAFFGTEEFSKEVISITEENSSLVKSDFGSENLLRIKNSTDVLGYVYIGNAPSKTATFDYLVIFDKNLVIAKSKVLVYREEYGGEIGSKRWLKQFIGKSKNDDIILDGDIDAISGATISVRSMTLAINDLLKSINILHQNKVL